MTKVKEFADVLFDRCCLDLYNQLPENVKTPEIKIEIRNALEEIVEKCSNVLLYGFTERPVSYSGRLEKLSPDDKRTIEIKNPKPFSETWNNLSESEKIVCKQSAEAQKERLFLAQLQQNKSTYLVCFDNGYNYGHVSAIDLYNFQKLKMQYNQIINARKEYLQELQRERSYSAIINPKEYADAYKIKLMETEPYLNEIIKAAQLFIMPFNHEIEKIIDETTNQVVKI